LAADKDSRYDQQIAFQKTPSWADPAQLYSNGWPLEAIAVWCFPYSYDVHGVATFALEQLLDTWQPPSDAGVATPAGSGRTGGLPDGEEPPVVTVETKLAERLIESPTPPRQRRQRSPDMSDDEFHRRLDEMGKRLVTGDVQGNHLTDQDKALIKKKRKLTKISVSGLLGIKRDTLDAYLCRCKIDWKQWKVQIYERHAGVRATTGDIRQ
jgi:hypothetical protein